MYQIFGQNLYIPLKYLYSFLMLFYGLQRFALSPINR